MQKQIIINRISKDLITADAAGAVIGGASGAGKSVLLNHIIYDMLAFYPAQYKAVFIDLKNGIELNKYRNTKHCFKFAATEKQAINTLQLMNRIMDSRYKELKLFHLNRYGGPGIIIFVDETAELLQSKQAAALLTRLSRLSRAANIKQICCTQSPNRKTIPADLALNLTYRIALHCENSIESRQLVNMPGAELLPWHGKAIYKKPGIDPVIIPVEMIPETDIQMRIKQNRKMI